MEKKAPKFQKSEETLIDDEVQKQLEKKAISETIPVKGQVVSTHISQTEEKRRHETGVEPEGAKSAHSISALQAGEHEWMSWTCYDRGYYILIDGSEGCILQCIHAQGNQKVPEIQVEELVMPVHGDGVWIGTSSSHIHQAPEAGDCVSKKDRNKNHDISRRYPDSKSKPSETVRGHEDSGACTRESRVPHKLGEDGTTTKSGNGVFGANIKQCGDDDLTTKRQDDVNSGGVQKHTALTTGKCEEFSEANRQANGFHSGGTASTPKLQAPADDGSQRSANSSELRHNGKCQQTMQGPDVVDPKRGIMQRQVNIESNSRIPCNDRRVECRTGSLDIGLEDSRSMDHGKGEVTHQCKEVEGRNHGVQGVCKAIKRCAYSATHGQCVSGSASEQETSPTSQILIQISTELWEFCMERYITVSAVYVPGKENQIADALSRGQEKNSSNWKLDQKIFHAIEMKLGEVQVDWFADRLNAQEVYYSWKPDPYATGKDAMQIDWKNTKGYAFPPFCLIGRVLRKVRKEGASLILITPTWPSQSWYPSLLEMIVACPILLPPYQALLTGPRGEHHPLIERTGCRWRRGKCPGTCKNARIFRRCFQTVIKQMASMHIDFLRILLAYVV